MLFRSTQQPADASAEAGASAAPIADTSADGVQQVAKTHKPQVEQQSFSAPAAVASNGGDASGDAGISGSGNGGGESSDNAVDPYSLAAEPRSRSAEPRQGSGSGSSDAPSTPAIPPWATPRAAPTAVRARRIRQIRRVSMTRTLSRRPVRFGPIMRRPGLIRPVPQRSVGPRVTRPRQSLL